MYCLEVTYEDGFVEVFRYVYEYQAELAYHHLQSEFECKIKEYKEN